MGCPDGKCCYHDGDTHYCTGKKCAKQKCDPENKACDDQCEALYSCQWEDGVYRCPKQHGDNYHEGCGLRECCNHLEAGDPCQGDFQCLDPLTCKNNKCA